MVGRLANAIINSMSKGNSSAGYWGLQRKVNEKRKKSEELASNVWRSEFIARYTRFLAVLTSEYPMISAI